MTDIISYTDGLQPPELEIWKRFRGEMPAWRMLDIGIGKGRTTPHFAPHVASYLALEPDARAMAEAQARFGRLSGNMSFLNRGIQDLNPEVTGPFDFILFSYNGLDYASPEERPAWLRRIRQCLSEEGLFLFSSHNLFYVSRPPPPLLWWHGPRPWRQAAAHFLQALSHPRPRRHEKNDYAVIRDGGRCFSVKSFCAKPAYHLKQLAEEGFTVLQIMDLRGRSLEIEGQGEGIGDPWIHYLVKKTRLPVSPREA